MLVEFCVVRELVNILFDILFVPRETARYGYHAQRIGEALHPGPLHARRRAIWQQLHAGHYFQNGADAPPCGGGIDQAAVHPHPEAKRAARMLAILAESVSLEVQSQDLLPARIRS